jgi:hypothetical protein
MKIETLKKLITDSYLKTTDMEQFKEEVLEFIDLYEKDNECIEPYSYDDHYEEVPYSTICGCNVMNGGSGMCNCTVANMMVKKPRNRHNITYTTTNEYH